MKFTARQVMLAAVASVALVVLLISRFSGSSASDVTRPQPAGTATSTTADQPTTVQPSAAPAEDEHGHEEGELTSEPPPIMINPTQQPDVKEAAISFTAAWLNTYGQTPEAWRASLTQRVTRELADELALADPATVPAVAKAGSDVKVTSEGSLFHAATPVIEVSPEAKLIGTLDLTVIRKDNRWVISEIDWQVAR